MSDTLFGIYFYQLLLQVPVLLACVAGIIAALVFWQRYPRPAMLTLISMALLLITTLAQSFLSIYIGMQFRQSQYLSINQVGWLLAVNTIIWGVIRAATFFLLLAAVFKNRKEPIPSSTATVFQ